MAAIEVKNLTKDFGNNKGVFDISFSVKKGEVVGFIGPNGAGKTTTIRQLLGFVKPDKGECRILNMEPFTSCNKIFKELGYIPGEITLLNDMKGSEFIEFIASLKKIKDLSYANYLMEYFDINPNVKIKKMSKGMKQKIGIIVAFMGDPKILVLDEPTSGLDPLMQEKFIDLINEKKSEGKTILMSSHIFYEIEKTCDRFVMIKNGKIVLQENVNNQNDDLIIDIVFSKKKDLEEFNKKHNGIINSNNLVIKYTGDINKIVSELNKYKLEKLNIRKESLEEKFMHLYGGESND